MTQQEAGPEGVPARPGIGAGEERWRKEGPGLPGQCLRPELLQECGTVPWFVEMLGDKAGIDGANGCTGHDPEGVHETAFLQRLEHAALIGPECSAPLKNEDVLGTFDRFLRHASRALLLNPTAHLILQCHHAGLDTSDDLLTWRAISAGPSAEATGASVRRS